ncbi:MAG: hypothetical protein ACOX6T_22500 [Myxococcales bacterium]
MKKACFLLLASFALAACSSTEEDPQDGDTDAGDSGNVAEWSLRVSGTYTWAASALTGDVDTHDPETAHVGKELPAATFQAEAASGGATAQARLEIQRTERAVSFVGHVSQTSPGPSATSSGGVTLTDLSVCVEARGATKVRLTYECSGTVTFSGAGGGTISASAGARTYCVYFESEEYSQPWKITDNVVEVDLADGKACWAEQAQINFTAAGGAGGTSSATADGTITMRFEPVY